jgi:hypothetical protein
MNLSKMLSTTVATVAVVGGIGLAVAQTTSPTNTDPNMQNQGTSNSQNTPTNRGSNSGATGTTGTGTMGTGTTGTTNSGATGTGTGTMDTERSARPDRN